MSVFVHHPGVGRLCGPQLSQREDVHCGHRDPPSTEGASRTQRQGESPLLRWGSLRPQRSWKEWWKDRYLEGGVEGFKWKWILLKLPSGLLKDRLTVCGGKTEKLCVFGRNSLNLLCFSQIWRNHISHISQQVYIKSSSFSLLGWYEGTNIVWKMFSAF